MAPPSTAHPAVPEPAADEQTLQATYRRPFDACLAGPITALALWSEGQLTVWSHSQAVFTLRGALAQALGMDEGRIRVIHVEGAGCYGHNGADDAALDAALAARALPDRPILLKWTRWDEHAWEPYGSAMLLQLRARLTEAGEISDWNHDVWSSPIRAVRRSACGLPVCWRPGICSGRSRRSSRDRWGP